jgi:hypothetical protein
MRFRPVQLASLLAAILQASTCFAQAERKPLENTEWGSLSGKVTWVGKETPETVSWEAEMKKHPDAKCCLAPGALPEEKIDRTWMIDPKTKGVANVIVFLKPTTGNYFPLEAKDRKRADTVVIDQPHCAFLSFITPVHPYYFDGKKLVETGQTLKIKNSSTVPHNVNAQGNPLDGNPGFNTLVPSGKEITHLFKPSKIPVQFTCNLHPWMKGYVWPLEHPYVAVTKADGSFTIPRVPAGIELHVVAWHPGQGWVINASKDGAKTKLKAGENVFDVMIK